MKVNLDIFASILYEVFKRSLEIGTFPSCMKLVNVTRVYKKIVGQRQLLTSQHIT